MRAAIMLGFRLAFQTTDAGRLRSILVGVASAIGALVLVTLAAVHHESVGTRDLSAQFMFFTWFDAAVVGGLGLPVLVLAATVGRLSASMRDRRLSNLRLLGLSPVRTRAVAMTEVGVAAVAGTVAGTALFFILRPYLSLVVRDSFGPAFGSGLGDPGLISPWPLALAAIVVGLPLVVAGMASLPQRLDTASALRRARRADAQRPGWWRLAPLTMGAAWCVYFATTADGPHGERWLTLNLLGSISTLGLGLIVVLPVAVRLMGDALLATAKGPTSTIAARRIQAQPAGVTRVISGLLIGLALITGAQCVLAAFESTPQYQASERSLTEQQQASVTIDPAMAPHAAEKLRAIPGVTGVIAAGRLSTVGCDDGDPCLYAIVMSCTDLAQITPGATGCRDSEALWLVEPFGVMPPTAEWTSEENARGVEIPLPTRVVDSGPGYSVAGGLNADILIPTELAQRSGLAVGPSELIVLAPPGRDLIDQIFATGLEDMQGITMMSDPSTYDYVQSLHALLRLVSTIILSLGLASFAIASVDRAFARRREVVALQIVGVPRKVLRRAQLLESTIPIGLGSVLSVVLGLAGGATYLALEPTAHIPWSTVLSLAALAAVGAAVVAGLTVIASSPPIRPELLRAE